MHNKTILISGCSAGLGLATAKLFLSHDWNVIATMRSPQHCHELTDSPELIKVAMDVTDKGSIKAAVQAGVDAFGHIDILLNNAGFGGLALFEETSDENFRAMFETNFFGHLNVIREVLPNMRQRQSGSIINVTSLAGSFSFPVQSGYCASKFAFSGFSEAINWELKEQGIDTTIFELGGMRSEFPKHMKNQRDLPISDYDAYMKRMAHNLKSALDKFMSKATSVEDVAEQVLKLAEMKNKPLRFHPTKDGKILSMLKRILPEKSFRKISTMGLDDT
jgi:NAD(P)-dependent dehydrogenase (short-subunit alcohol dehydrogenase family)